MPGGSPLPPRPQMPAPTFLCLGPPKCGTTWLAAAVAAHPDVLCGAKKELDYFASPNYDRGRAWYEAQFTDGDPAAPAVGEFSPGYVRTVPCDGGDPADRRYGVAERVAADYPDLKLVVVLRDPVDRAVSAYFHALKGGGCRPGESIFAANRRRDGILECSKYAAHLTRWLSLFDRSRLLTLCFERDVANRAGRAAALRRVFAHLGVDPGFSPPKLHAPKNVRPSMFELRRRHAGPAAAALMARVPPAARAWPVWDVRVPGRDRAALAARFAPDVADLERLLGRRFPWPRVGGTLPVAGPVAAAARRAA